MSDLVITLVTGHIISSRRDNHKICFIKGHIYIYIYIYIDSVHVFDEQINRFCWNSLKVIGINRTQLYSICFPILLIKRIMLNILYKLAVVICLRLASCKLDVIHFG